MLVHLIIRIINVLMLISPRHYLAALLSSRVVAVRPSFKFSIKKTPIVIKKNTKQRNKYIQRNFKQHLIVVLFCFIKIKAN